MFGRCCGTCKALLPRFRISSAELDAATYTASDVVHAAVEQTFGIIGEALNQLAKLDPALTRRVPNLHDSVAFRNLLIHGYATVDHRRVWQTASQSLPELRTVVDAPAAAQGWRKIKIAESN
jgi:uncharacterized protein with HEPN domain